MFKCIRCPTAYHFNPENKKDKDDECVPAGSVLIAGTSIICPKHFNVRKVRLPVLTVDFSDERIRKAIDRSTSTTASTALKEGI